MTARSRRAHTHRACVGGTRETNALCVAVPVVACSTNWKGSCARSRLLRRSLSQSPPRSGQSASQRSAADQPVGQSKRLHTASQSACYIVSSELSANQSLCPIQTFGPAVYRLSSEMSPEHISWHRLASWLCHRRTMDSSRVTNGHRPPQRTEFFILFLGMWPFDVCDVVK